MRLTFRGLSEDRPGAAWRKVFAHGWPGWRAWFLARGGDGRPRLREAERALRRHMPEMEPVWQRLVDAVGGDDEVARFLSFWTPPPYLVSCSQAVAMDDDGPLLIRNYDLDPALNESTMLHSAWRGRRVMGMAEGMAGLADGMNESGLAASLTFGGRTVVGPGFGVPLIMRYVLEVCDDTDDAVEALRAVPCHMSYNVTVLDRRGRWATVFLSPDRPALVTDRRATTNHQPGDTISQRGHASRTRERERRLERLLADPRRGGADLARAFARAPLFSTEYHRAFGTVYTAAYRPGSGEATLSWRSGPAMSWRMDAFRPSECAVTYSPEGSTSHVSAGRPAAAPAPLSEFFAELASCLAGERDWAALGAFWPPRGDPA